VSEQALHSIRKNSPLMGARLTGRARAVITGGKLHELRAGGKRHSGPLTATLAPEKS